LTRHAEFETMDKNGIGFETVTSTRVQNESNLDKLQV